ncbi:MbtH family protein [Erwinia sp. OLTSP20]|uniref:MbtH family protein n=1 Tax=unclassified Erwinia TaxID=2622719 RepID=UPI000C174A5E|nr:MULTISPECIES: MbtH family NRPS accessory protein [unclassified Erwinia]PIJ50202.1 MbtH family protein [Erwinia sp. OAMSP11]PIJ72039.1 MbtH family protein [Erwinia sp. OLSSP12]PIJ81330.1 MbtH family protein [Erwinia sp. OLCASP19]PIJ84036.1 MbtH family protein [Erwinia sp. OLMTSP26]PIJ85735.1 MbtH family protein [Erwinia sp. OLMDSP33]
MQFSNPFDDAQGQFYILGNAHQQFSLWPQQCRLPAGWDVLCPPQAAEECQAWLQRHWTSLSPDSFSS